MKSLISAGVVVLCAVTAQAANLSVTANAARTGDARLRVC
jgi:hypothetical protein